MIKIVKNKMARKKQDNDKKDDRIEEEEESATGKSGEEAAVDADMLDEGLEDNAPHEFETEEDELNSMGMHLTDDIAEEAPDYDRMDDQDDI